MASIEINGKKIEAENGKMIIEVADEVGIAIPRFCYHKKLSVAANCRMCLVQLDNAKKTVPACATPITDGMKVFTNSPAAIQSQQAVMEFLLINHPLDCPVCDQGGECELQDVSMGYGLDSSVYNEDKRAVADDDLGPLISTEMTRCIHCTRCVRFGDEIAGLRELGGMGRGESMGIGTYVKHSMSSEVSGNIIDLCPVGALTSKPYRFSGRSWEMSQHDGIAPHDCLGSHVHYQVRQGRVMRVVPKEVDAVNENWISDRDRFSYLGLNVPHRAQTPMIKVNDEWKNVSWPEALAFTAQGISRVIKTHGAKQFAAFSSLSATVEEHYLLQKLMRSLGVNNLDHRLQQTDFRDDAEQSMMPTSGISFFELEQQQVIVVLGSQLVREVPLAGIRLRKAQRNGAKIYAMNPVHDDLHVQMTEVKISSPQDFFKDLVCVLAALEHTSVEMPDELSDLCRASKPDASAKAFAKALTQPHAVLITGAFVENHPDAASLRMVVRWITLITGAKHLRLTAGANSAGAWAAGMVPHRDAGGVELEQPGYHADEAIKKKLRGYFLLGVEPEFDFTNPHQALQSMLASEFVVVMSGFAQGGLLNYADVILPMGLSAETSGTFVNVDKTWQTFTGAVAPPSEARPGWKILRVLGNQLKICGFDYQSSDEVLDELKTHLPSTDVTPKAGFFPPRVEQSGFIRVGEWPLYRCDALVRHAPALQNCAAADTACIRLHPTTADAFALNGTVTVSQGEIEITLPLKRDERVAPNAVWVANAMAETMNLGYAFASIKIKSE